MALQCEEDIAAAGGEIEHTRGALRGHGPDQSPAPIGIEAAAHGEIHDVVPGRDAAKHGRDRFGRLMRKVFSYGGVVGGRGHHLPSRRSGISAR